MPKPTVDRFIVQDSWNEEEDQELREYLEASPQPVEYMSADDILELKISPTTMLFADSSLIQRHLGSNEGSAAATPVVDTYPDELKPLYKRDIKKVRIGTFLAQEQLEELPYFCKLAGSNKDFAARVVHTLHEDNLVRAALQTMHQDGHVYICQVVDFVAEFRLFLSPDKIWGQPCEYSEYMVGHRLLNANDKICDVLEVKDVPEVPPAFVKQVLEASRKLGFCVVDVGLTAATNEWSVVECNPAFALSSYDLDMETYVSFCVSAWWELLAELRSSNDDSFSA